MFLQKNQRFLWFFLIFAVLFSFFEIQNVQTILLDKAIFVSAGQPEKVILGGNAVGFCYEGEGVLVLSTNQNASSYVDESQIVLQEGDVITKIDDTLVFCSREISNCLKNLKQDFVTVTFLREGKTLSTKIKPYFDKLSNSLKLGVWTKDEVSGLGTLTYINPNNGFYGALGHPLLEGTTKKVLPVKTGRVYGCNILGISKGAKGIAGELKGMISKNQSFGTVAKNTNFGIFGHIENAERLSFSNLVEVGGRKTAKPGYAQIYTSIDNAGPKPYDIQIIKTNYQSTSNSKSMVLKITDKELLSKTGGIVQGMSGSPIVQNGKLIGAVTHVFTGDSAKGFGIYIDWMM